MTAHLLAASAIASVLTFGTFLLSSASAADSSDEFAIRVILAELSEQPASRDFEERLEREARDYCRDNYTGSDRLSLRRCEDAVVTAVYDAIEEDADQYGLRLTLSKLQ